MTIRQSISTGAARQTRLGADRAAIGAAPGGPVLAPPRIVLSLTEYLRLGDERACFACGYIGEPIPLTADEASGANERRCGRCGSAAAVLPERAVKDGWLDVRDADGRSVVDQRQSLVRR